MARLDALLCVSLSVFLPAALQETVSDGSVLLTVIRHGQSVDNVFPRQGPFGVKDPSLSKAGMAQAKALADNLKEWPRPDLVFSSCLLRSQETALLGFPNQTVHVAPHIVETCSMDVCLPEWANPGDYWNGKGAQQNLLERDLGRAASARLSFDADTCGPPDWNAFLKWLWSRQDVQSVLAQAARPHIAVVSHGNFLGQLLAQHGFDHGHPKNAETFSATLPYSTSGFGYFTDVEVVFGGFSGGDAKARVYWLLTCAGALLLCVALCLSACGRRRLCNVCGRGAEDEEEGEEDDV
eukprot:TRINITY_DN16543_c0_g1_i1.p1 TRINITY_DN16543_c0_g1~~TRINITY_DN16543_c0_g1_i1.p1  ORF type:complete len:314 (-),score=32.80 TRINITY_DN16543_c0_g1_i1:226-1110(-)